MLIHTEEYVLMPTLDPGNASTVYHHCFFSEYVHVLACVQGLTSAVLGSNLGFETSLQSVSLQRCLPIYFSSYELNTYLSQGFELFVMAYTV